MKVIKKWTHPKMILRVSSVFGVFFIAGMALAFGQEPAAAGAAAGHVDILKWLALGGGVGLGLAALGCGMGQGRLVASAMDGIARNPQASKDMFVPMILGLAFIEALTIYSLIFVFIFKAAVLG